MAEPTDDPMALRELVPAEPLLPDPGLPPWAWAAIALAAIALAGLVMFLRRQKSAIPDLRLAREQAYRRALKHAGYMPVSVEMAVERDHEWIKKGRDK